MIPGLPANINQIKGFLADDEAEALYQAALTAGDLGPVLEIGSYCGKSTIYLGLACRQTDNTVFALDHHRGSEEHQQGEFFHDPELYDDGISALDTFREFRRNIEAAGLNDSVVPVVSDSQTASRHWRTPLGMLFIDGGHSLDAALNDYRCWVSAIARGGVLAIHDVFTNAGEGGQAPHAVYRLAKASGLFSELARVNSLALLQRL